MNDLRLYPPPLPSTDAPDRAFGVWEHEHASEETPGGGRIVTMRRHGRLVRLFRTPEGSTAPLKRDQQTS